MNKTIEILNFAKELIKESKFPIGICSAITSSSSYNNHKISDVVNTYNWFRKQKPTESKHEEYYNSPLFKKYSPYWWSLDEEGKQQRILFLEKLIKELKE